MTTPTQGEHAQPEALRPEMLDDLIETFRTAGLGRYNLMRVELPRHQWAQLAAALRRHATPAQPAAPQGGAYAELPDEHAAFETWARLRSDWRPNLERKGDGYVGAFADEAWRGWSARASHGQAPAGAAADGAECSHCVGTGRIDTGKGALGREVYAACPECAPTAQPAPAATPQADSQPAPQGETNVQLDTDSNHSAPGQQRDVVGTVALGQPVGHGSDATAGDPSAQGDKLLTVAERNIRSFLRSAVFKSESDREAALNCVDVLYDRAARAPADSVTAPAGGAVAELDPVGMVPVAEVVECEKMGQQALREIDGRWRWLSIGERLYARADTGIAAAPTPAAQGDAEDAADPLQGAANWLAQAHGQFCTAVLQGCLMIGYNRAKRLHDAALAAKGGA